MSISHARHYLGQVNIPYCRAERRLDLPELLSLGNPRQSL
jgi:hypothetical protein